MSSKLTALLVGLLLFSTIPAFAAPNLINYQGMLTDDAGQPIDGPVELTFALYNTASGGDSLWSETETVTVTHGLYDAVLGDGTTLDLPFDQPYFLGVTVTGDAEMDPRQPLTTVSTALKAGVAEAVTQPLASAALQDGSVPMSKLAMSCNVGEILVMTASGWGCGPSPY